MKKAGTNRFFKGIDTDTSLLDRQGDVMLDALNIRITNAEEDNLFAVNLAGNKEEFSLADGFLPIGSVEFNGVLFILSADSNGNSEIGTFPSPANNGDGSGFVREYKPLQNFTTTSAKDLIDLDCSGQNVTNPNRIDFNTPHLKLNQNYRARVLARIDYDNSVKLFWTDNINPARSINTGFDIDTGLYNNRFVNADQIINGNINIVNENNFIPTVEFNNLQAEGSLKPGNYYVFVRYVDIAFNTTSFLGSSRMIPVHGDVPNENIAYGVEKDLDTNKKINLTIRNLDTESFFVELAYVLYNQEGLSEVKLIDKRYQITSNVQQFEINGFEDTLDITLDEVLAFKPSDALFCQDMTQLNNQLYIANTRGRQIDHPDLRNFFCNIVIEERVDSNIQNNDHSIKGGNNRNYYQSIDAHEAINKNLGYFSGETYVFAAVPVFKGGFYGLAYPMEGCDFYTGVRTNINKEGIFRFSNPRVERFYDRGATGGITKIKHVRFNTNSAVTIYNNSSWLQENLIGFYFCRGERVKNLLYQGILVGCYSGETLSEYPLDKFGSDSAAGNAAIQTDGVSTKKHMPLIEPVFPFFEQWSVKALTHEAYGPAFYGESFNKKLHDQAEKLAIFSLDYYIDRANGGEGVPTNGYIEKIARLDENNDWIVDVTNQVKAPLNYDGFTTATHVKIAELDTSQTLNPLTGDIAYTETIENQDYPRYYVQKGLDWSTGNANNIQGFEADMFNVAGWDETGVFVDGNNYVSKVPEGDPLKQGMFYRNYDRSATDRDEWCVSIPSACPDYILLSNTGTLTSNVNQWKDYIVNVHKTNPELINILNVYTFRNVVFSPISNYHNIDNLKNGYNEYNGDCFIGRNYLKIQNHHDEDVKEPFLDIINWAAQFSTETDVIFDVFDAIFSNNGLIYRNHSHGKYLSLVSENSYNPNFRFSKGRNSFYPRDFDFVRTKNSPESNLYNTGYKNLLSPRKSIGIDIYQPISSNEFPTRIRASSKHTINALKDGYLEFPSIGFKDFDYQYGGINAIIDYNDNLFTFQDDAINYHPINERSLSESSNSDAQFVLGQSTGLTEFKQTITFKYGTQHQWSVVRTEFGVYGFDWNKRTFWRVTKNGFENLSVTKNTDRWFREIVDQYSSGVSDITDKLPNTLTAGLGIHSVFDKRFKEVITTFNFNENSTTIAFNEKGNLFQSKYSFTPKFYSLLEEDLYSFHNGKFWRHDATTDYNNFYNVQENSYIEIIVSHTPEITKHFDNLIINSNNVEFDKIEYKTQHQLATQNPFSGEFWNKPIYREMEWKLPIRRADVLKNPDLNIALVQSRLRGKFLKIKLYYNSNKKMWVREIITFYTISKA